MVDFAEVARHDDRRRVVRRTDDYYWLQRLCEVTGDGYIVVDSHLHIAASSDAAAALLEVPATALMQGADFTQLTLHLAELGYFGPGDPLAFQALLKDVLVNQRMKQSGKDYAVRLTTSQSRQIDLTISHGRDDRFIVVIRDKSDFHLEEQALTTALEVGESGYWRLDVRAGEYDLKGALILRSDAFGRGMFITHRDMRDIIHKDDVTKALRALQDCIKQRKPQAMTTRIVSRTGDVVWLKSHMMPQMDDTGQVRSVVCFFHDVTAQLRSQDDLRSAQQAAERALKAKNAFLGRLSHEIRTPMNAVIGMADALIHHHNDAAINPKLTLIQDSAEQIVRLVDETLQHTKLEDEKIELCPREADPRILLGRVCELWSDQARKTGTEVCLRVDPSVPPLLRLDDFRLEQCLNNLMSNAVKFTEAGRIDVVLSTAGGSVTRKLVIAVRDTGIGMSPEQQQQVFLPYKQADASIRARYGGTGLGMAITKDLVELMGGQITLRSEAGQGTLFAVTLPLVLPQEHAVGSDVIVDTLLPKEEKMGDHSQLRVLIVDDNSTNHMVVGSLLKNIVGETVTAMNGEEAIARLSDSGPFDVVLMDIHMPVMDGIEATLAIRSCTEDYANVPIIALTADPQYQQARLCKNIGMDDALSKPVRLSQLLESFDTVLVPQQSVISEAA